MRTSLTTAIVLALVSTTFVSSALAEYQCQKNDPPLTPMCCDTTSFYPEVDCESRKATLPE
jgi:hypothetical protein